MDEILDIIYKYYPRDTNPNDSAYTNSLEFRRLIVAIKNAEDKLSKWNLFLSDLEDEFGVGRVNDWTQLFNKDACYKLRICILDSDVYVTEMAIHISIISDYFSLYTSTFDKKNRFNSLPLKFVLNSDLERNNFELIKKYISKHYPAHNFLDPHIANKIVPDIAIENYTYGKATVFHGLFTTHIW